ncbi:hypothetical protein SeLEV6574_g07600 [Synchytrium endobioticum]|uniref:Myb-like domain-containing protein n=1 Tax=Synchytrium endobioticum TaxID=286115 RepID=A0A507CH55_9FUNG|nr:hypothetical protein SeLEV6574_g07600 [Synchytrium endobioticum]
MPPKKGGSGSSRGVRNKKKRDDSDDESEEIPYDDESPPLSDEPLEEDADMDGFIGVMDLLEEQEGQDMETYGHAIVVKRTPAKKARTGLNASPSRGTPASTTNLPGGLTPAQQQQQLNDLYRSIPAARWQQIAQTIAKIKGGGIQLAPTADVLVPLMKELHSKGQLPFPLPVPGAPIFPAGTMPSPFKHDHSGGSGLGKGTPSGLSRGLGSSKDDSAPPLAPVKDESTGLASAALAASLGVRQSLRARKVKRDYNEDSYIDTLLMGEEQRLAVGRASIAGTPAPQSAGEQNSQMVQNDIDEWPLPTRAWPRTKKTAIRTPIPEIQWVLPNPPMLAFGPDYNYNNPTQSTYTFQHALAGGASLGQMNAMGLGLGGVNMMYTGSDDTMDGDFDPSSRRRYMARAGRATTVDMSLAALRVQKKPRIKWTDDEVGALEDGMRQHGTRWSAIEALHGRNGTGRLGQRDQVQLKDKARVEKARRIKLGLSLGPFERASN